LSVADQLVSDVATASVTPNRVRTLVLADVKFTLVNIWHIRTINSGSFLAEFTVSSIEIRAYA